MDNNLLEQLKKYFDSDEGKNFVIQEQNKIMFSQKHIKKYITKLHNMEPEDREILFCKLKTKYDSNEYHYRWTSRGIEPPKDLYGYILEYGVKYGKINDIEDANFGYESYIIDNSWVITCWYGQGCSFNFYKLNN